MLVKTVGFIVIVATCALIGIEMSKELSGRVKSLEAWISAVKIMQLCIGQFKLPLAKIYPEVSEKEPMLKPFFENVTEGDKKSWKREICKMKNLTKKDILVLNKLGCGIGEKLSDEQIGFLDYIKNLLEENLKEAKLDEKQNGKMYRSLSFFAGVGIAVLLV